MNRTLLALIALVIVGTILTIQQFNDTSNRKITPSQKRTKSVERSSKTSDRDLRSSSKLSPDELLELVYEQYPELQLDYDPKTLPTQNQLTDFTNWYKTHYPNDIQLPKSLSWFRYSSFNWNETLANEAHIFLEQHQELRSLLQNLASSEVSRRQENYSSYFPLHFDFLFDATYILVLENSLAHFENRTIDAQMISNTVRSLSLLPADHPSDYDARERLHYRSYKMFNPDLDRLPSMESSFESSANSLRLDIVTTAHALQNINIPRRFKHDPKYQKEYQFRRFLRETPEKYLLTVAKVYSHQIDLFRTLSKSGRFPSEEEFKEVAARLSDPTFTPLGLSSEFHENLHDLSFLTVRTATLIQIDELTVRSAISEASKSGVTIRHLDELIPAYLEDIPSHPISGEPLTYDHSDKNFEIAGDPRVFFDTGRGQNTIGW